MMKSFRLRIVTPDGEFFSGEAVQLTLRSIDGDVSILAGHIPYVTAIGAGECRVYIKEGEEPRHAACIGGILSVTKEAVSVAATTFEWSEDIDVARAKLAKSRAEEAAKRSKDGDDSRIAEMKLKRALIRINVAEK